MKIIRSRCSPVLVVVLTLAVLAVVSCLATAQETAKVTCNCACKGHTRAFCAYHKCPCNPLSNSRLQGVVLETPDGTVSMALPPDIAPGDTISGTVFVEPPEGAPADATDVLQGYVLETPDKKHKIDGLKKLLTFTVPPTGIIPFVLRDPGGGQVASGDSPTPGSIPIDDVAYPEGPPHAVKSGDVFQVGGEFDGIGDTTTASLGETPCEVIAESPRGMLLEPTGPIAGTGPMDLKIDDAGRVTEYTMNVLGVALSADKTALRRGESTQVHTTISGADGLGEGDCAVELTMAAGSAAQFIGVSGGTITHEVDPAGIGPDGSYSFDTGVRGLQPGSFAINATLCSGNEKTFTFPNNGRGAKASNDLHIEWSRSVTVKEDKPFGTTNGSGTSRTDHSDGNVGVNGSGSVTVDWSGTMPKVKRWWYTKDGKRSGPIHTGNP